MSALLKPQPDLFKPRIDAPAFPWNDQTEADIWEAFDARWELIPMSGCWVWTAADNYRYGVMRFMGRMRTVHRLAYERWVGPIPRGKQVCHRCDVTYCINPDHLFLGTQLENMRDMIAKGRARPGRKGLDHRPWKLTDADVAEIRTKKKSGVGYAKQFKISPRSVYNIWTGHTWR